MKKRMILIGLLAILACGSKPEGSEVSGVFADGPLKGCVIIKHRMPPREYADGQLLYIVRCKSETITNWTTERQCGKTKCYDNNSVSVVSQ